MLVQSIRVERTFITKRIYEGRSSLESINNGTIETKNLNSSRHIIFDDQLKPKENEYFTINPSKT